MKVKSLTLIELIVSLVLVGGVILGITSASVFFVRKVIFTTERYNMYSQISGALEDMKMRCLSAINIDTAFVSDGITSPELEFNGEVDIYQVTPDDLSDNAQYRYYVDDSGRLVLENKTADEIETLIESKFSPQLAFSYTLGDAPNFITVDIIAKSSKDSKAVISRTEGIRFWFVDAVK